MKKLVTVSVVMALCGTALASESGLAPMSSTAISMSSWIRNVVLSPAVPQDATPMRGHSDRFRADIFYNSWEMTDNSFINPRTVDGNVMGINPLIAFGNEVEAVLLLPMHASGEGSGTDAYHLGADLTLQTVLGDTLKMGGHGNYIRTEFKNSDDGEGSGVINAGPFAALSLQLGAASLSLGGVLSYIVPEKSDETDNFSVLTGAANIGLPLGGALAANLYGLYHYHVDSEMKDFNHLDLGTDLVVALGETWLVSVGARMLTGIEEIDSMEFFLGSEWVF